MRLAFIAALQYLPARQRAVLILRDVLQWRAAEVADLLGTTATAVNGMLARARARARLEQVAPAEDEIREPASPDDRALADRYAEAFEKADITALTQLLREDAVFEMPPRPTWFAGREAIGAFLQARVLREPGNFRGIPTAANGQPQSRATGARMTACTGHTHYRCSPSPRRTSRGSPRSSTRACSRDSACRRPFPLPLLPPLARFRRQADDRASAMTRPPEGIRLLEPAVRYALTAAAGVTPEFLSRPTPCRGWDLRMLLLHASESLDAIHEGIDAGRVGLYPAACDIDLAAMAAMAADPARAFRDRAGRLLAARTSPGHQGQVIEIAGCPLAASIMAGAGVGV